MSANDGEPAFPVTRYVNVDGETHESTPQGMTLRDYFAAKALNGLFSNSNEDWGIEDAVATAYLTADAMLKERDK